MCSDDITLSQGFVIIKNTAKYLIEASEDLTSKNYLQMF